MTTSKIEILKKIFIENIFLPTTIIIILFSFFLTIGVRLSPGPLIIIAVLTGFIIDLFFRKSSAWVNIKKIFLHSIIYSIVLILVLNINIIITDNLFDGSVNFGGYFAINIIATWFFLIMFFLGGVFGVLVKKTIKKFNRKTS